MKKGQKIDTRILRKIRCCSRKFATGRESCSQELFLQKETVMQEMIPGSDFEKDKTTIKEKNCHTENKSRMAVV